MNGRFLRVFFLLLVSRIALLLVGDIMLNAVGFRLQESQVALYLFSRLE